MSKVVITGNASGTGDFTIAAPNSNTNRTLTLPDEAGTVLTSGGALPAIDGSALINLPVNGLGVGQTPQVVTRTIGVTYYNTTGKPIYGGGRATGASGAGGWVWVQVNGANAYSGTDAINSTNSSTVYYIIPPDASYSIQNAAGTFSGTTIYELR